MKLIGRAECSMFTKVRLQRCGIYCCVPNLWWHSLHTRGFQSLEG